MFRCHSPHLFARLSSNDIPHFLFLLIIKLVFISREKLELLYLVHGLEDFLLACSAQKSPEIFDVSVRAILISVAQDLDNFGVLSFLCHLHEKFDELRVAEDLDNAMEQLLLLLLQ